MILVSLVASMLISIEEPTFVYLVETEQEALALTGGGTTQPTEAAKTLDDLIAQMNKRGPLTVKQERIIKQIANEEKEFIKLLNEFVVTPFSANDDGAYPEFTRIRDRIVKILLRSPDIRTANRRTGLLNQLQLENAVSSEQIKRFESLGEAIRDEYLVIEDRRANIRRALSILGAGGGMVIGGVVSYKVATKVKVLQMSDQAALSNIPKMVGQGAIVVAGVGVGATVGLVAGYWVTDQLLYNQIDLIHPFEENLDLRDLLLE